MKQKISIIIVVIALAVGGWIIFSKKSGTVDKPLEGIGQEKEEATQVESSGFGGQIFDKVGQNPAEKLPDVNAFEEEINPYKEAYTNPFE